MKFSPISYMHWAKTAGAGCEIFLSRSGLTPPPAEWLGPVDPDEALRFAESYGDPGVREAVAARYGASPEQVLTAAGTSEANFLICAALIRPEDLVAVEMPCYEPFVRVVEALGATVLPLERRAEEGYDLSLERLDEVLEAGVRLVMLSDLHNPTGRLLDRAVLAEAARRVAAANAWLLVDEVYLDFMFDKRPPSAFLLGERVISTSSLTKVYGLGSLRAGWAIGAPEVIAQAYLVRDHLGVIPPGPAVLYTRAAFRVLDRLAAWSAWRVAAGRAIIDRFLANEPRLRWVPPSGGIVGLLHLPEGIPDRTLCEHLEACYRTLLTPGDFFGAPGTVRVGFGGEPVEIEEGLVRLVKAIGDLEAMRRRG